MMTDLTAITTPLGLLDAETQAALKAHGGPYERFEGYGWVPCGLNDSWSATTYRVKPSPPKPREWWAAFTDMMHCGMWPTEAMAHEAMRDCAVTYELVHVREVLE